jgi:glycerol-3-phosphate acyltransferase PlsY
MKPEMQLLLLALGAYLLGSVPFGLLVGLARGVDVRVAGSGNIGATNVGRLLGGKFFILTFILDLLKSLLPMLVATWLLRRQLGPPDSYATRHYVLWLTVGFAAVLGHMFPVFLRFRGGKGVATSAGFMLGLWPYYTIPALFAIGIFALALLAWRYMSLASILGAVAFPIAYALVSLALGWDILGRQWPLLALGVLVAALVTYKHRGNLARLRAGTEPKFMRKPAAAATSAAVSVKPQPQDVEKQEAAAETARRGP